MPRFSAADWNEKFVRPLAEAGLDLVGSFDVSLYNRFADERGGLRPLEDFGRGSALGFVVGNTRALWSVFEATIATDRDLAAADHPLDQYVEKIITAHLRALQSQGAPEGRARFSHEGGDRLVSMLDAADLSGLARRGPAHLAVRPQEGPWLALRAVVSFDAPAGDVAGAFTGPAVPHPCEDCGQPCTTALDAAIALTGDGRVEDFWQSWVAVRDACPLGKGFRYGEAQMRYHYAKDRSVLTPG